MNYLDFMKPEKITNPVYYFIGGRKIPVHPEIDRMIVQRDEEIAKLTERIRTLETQEGEVG